jgi:hypothetical protein
VLGGIIYVLRAGVPWRLLPAGELGCGSPVTCWRRLRDWQQAGVWEQLHHRLLDWLGDDGQVDWSRAVIGTRGRPGRPRWRPAKLHADKGDDFPSCRQALRRRKISPRIARRGVEPGQVAGSAELKSVGERKR